MRRSLAAPISCRPRTRPSPSAPLAAFLGVALVVALAVGACGDGKKQGKAGKGKFGLDSMSPARPGESARPAAVGPAARQAPSARPAATGKPGVATGAALTDGFTRWRPIPAFLGEKVFDLAAIGGGHAVVLTDDNHVGVTKDGGKSWHYQRMLHGASLAVHGRQGGPYFVMGKAGYVAWSRDGLEWEDLPRLTEKDLIDVAANSEIAAGVTRGGLVVSYTMDGKRFRLFELPNGKWPSRIHTVAGKILIVVGKEVWMTPDQGKTWQVAAAHPTLPDPRQVVTSQGVCQLGRVERTWGMVCRVRGTGYGITDKDILVVDRDQLQVSHDGGATWQQASLPFAGARHVGGFPGGPYFALGTRGSLARSPDGVTWVKLALESTATLNDLHTKGDNALIVGTGGTVLRSTDRGKSWTKVETGSKQAYNQILFRNGSLLLPTFGKLLVSKDNGSTWQEAEDKTVYGELPRPGVTGKCPGNVPKAGKVCRVAVDTSTPESFPQATLFDFQGEFGVLGGTKGLVAVTSNGGADWKYMTGYRFWGAIQDLQVRGARVVVVAHKEIMASTDGGRSWQQGALPARRGTFHSAYIDDDGAVYVAGEAGTLLKSTGNLSAWQRLEPGANQWVAFRKVRRAGAALYAAGMKGELYRSADRGATWTRLWTGQGHPVVNLVAKGDVLLAITSTSAGRWWTRRGDSVLLRSDDGGRHFRVLGVLSAGGSGADFQLDAEGRVLYHNLLSPDMGRTWTKRQEHYWDGVTPVGDGTGRHIGNRRFREKRDLFYVVSGDMRRYAVVESFYHENAMLRCDPKAGCWMACGQVVYQPF